MNLFANEVCFINHLALFNSLFFVKSIGCFYFLNFLGELCGSLSLCMHLILESLMEFYQLRHEKWLNMKTRVTPYADNIINHETEASRRLQCRQAGELEFQVLFPEYTDVVHLDRRSCTCRK